MVPGFLAREDLPPVKLPFHRSPHEVAEKEKEVVKKGELVPQKEPKQQRTAKDNGRASSVESKEVEHLVDVRYLAWNPRLELDGMAIPWSFAIREF